MKHNLVNALTVGSLLALQFSLLVAIRENALFVLWVLETLIALLYARWLATHQIELMRIKPRFTLWNGGKSDSAMVGGSDDRYTALEIAFRYAINEGVVLLIETATDARWLIQFRGAGHPPDFVAPIKKGPAPAIYP
jgi:hypothetical protein